MLDKELRSTAESTYGRSFADVTVETGPEADAHTRALGAKATTEGTTIRLRSDYRPGTLEGDAVLAHELAHVVQQGAAAARPETGVQQGTAARPKTGVQQGTAARPKTGVQQGTAARPETGVQHSMQAAGPASAEHEADQAAASVLARSSRHAPAIRARTGVDPSTTTNAPTTPKLTTGLGLRLQRCTDTPDYALSQRGPASESTSPTYGGARQERTGPVGLFDYRDGYYRATLDGDGDQSAELDLALRGTDPDSTVFRKPQRMEVVATRLGNTPERGGEGSETHTTSFDIRGERSERDVRPILRQRTDGRDPTVIAAARGPYVDFATMNIHPPSPDGAQADYRMVVSRPVGYGSEQAAETRTVSFHRDPNDIYPVFVPGRPRRAGSIWVLDVTMGLYGDQYRFTFRKPDPTGSAVRMGISPMSGGAPVGAEAVNLSVAGPLDVEVVRARGPVLELDLNGDGNTDIRVYERFDPESDMTRASHVDQPSRFRLLTLTITNADGSQRLGGSRRQVSEGQYDQEAVHMEQEFDVVSAAATAEGLEQAAAVPDLAADMAGVQRQLNELRALAVQRNLLPATVSNAYQRLVDAWLALAGSPPASGGTDYRTPAVNAALAFDTIWTAETAAGTTTTNHDPPGGRNDPWSETQNPYTGLYQVEGFQREPVVTQRLAAALTRGDLAASSRLISDLGRRVARWVERRLREGGLRDEAQRAAALIALSPMLDRLADRRDLKRVTAVFHSAPEYIQSGRPSSLPLRLYYWKEGSTWYLQDLTHPTREDSVGILSTSASTGQTEPPHSLFEKLNNKKRYPKGYIQYQLPGEAGRAATVRTTEPWEVSDVLGWISLGLAGAALLAGVVLTGGAAAVAVPLLWTASAAVGAAGAVAHMVEEHDQGRLRGSTIVMDLAQIVGSLAGGAVSGARAIGAFRYAGAVSAAARTGAAVTQTAAQLVPLSTGTLRLLTITQIASDSVQVLLMSGELARQLQAISDSRMSDGDKLRAYVLAIGQFGATVGLTYVSIRANVTELRTALARGGSLVQFGEHTLVPGMFTEAQYVAELERRLAGNTHALEGMASQRVRVVPPSEAGSTIGLARVEFVGGKPRIVVVDGAPLSAIREEAVHLEQLALARRSTAEISEIARRTGQSEAELLRTRRAASQLIEISERWATATPQQRLAAHRYRLDLEEDGQRRIIAQLQADINAGRPVNPVDVDNAFQNLDNIRHRRADIVGAEQHVSRGGRVGDIDPQLDQAPGLFSKKTVPSAEIDPAWRTLSEDDFVRTYLNRYPNSTLSADELRARYRMDQRLNPGTGRLVDVNREVVDVPAQYRPGEERVQLQGPGRATLESSEQTRITELLGQRDVARREREAARTRVPPDVDAAHAAQYRMNEATRLLGEHAGSVWVRRAYPGPPRPEIVYPRPGAPSRSGDFDQVWRCVTGEGAQRRTVWVVVEAKGGSADLGSRRTAAGPRAEQGTRLYFDDILDVMFAAGGEARQAVINIRTARADPNQQIRYVHVSAPVETVAGPGTTGPMSQAADIRVREFDISSGTPTAATTGTVTP